MGDLDYDCSAAALKWPSAMEIWGYEDEDQAAANLCVPHRDHGDCFTGSFSAMMRAVSVAKDRLPAAFGPLTAKVAFQR